MPKSNIKFKVQIAASKNKLELKPYNFSGLNSITRLKSGNYIVIITVKLQHTKKL